MTQKSKLAIELRKEGLRFLELGIQAATKDPCTADDARLAVLYCWTAIELLFKHPLHNEHWTLILESNDKANLDAYRYGDIQTIGFEACIKRLASILKITIKKYEKQRLDALRLHRNKLVHTGLSESIPAELSTIADALSVLLSFISQHLENLSASEKKSLSRVRENLSQLQQYVTSRWAAIKEKVDHSASVTVCPFCRQRAVILSFRKVKCEFCQTSFDVEEFANLFWTAVVDGDVEISNCAGPIRCPKCMRVSAVLQDLVAKCLLTKHESDDHEEIISCNSTSPPSEDIARWCGADLDECKKCGDTVIEVSHMDKDAVDYGYYWICTSCEEIRTSSGANEEDRDEDY